VDFSFTEEEKMLQKAIRSFAEKEIAPLVEEAEANQKFPRQVLRKLADLGYLCVNYPEEYGGGGLGTVAECVIIEEMAYVCGGISSGVMIQSGIGTSMILDNGTEEQKQKYVVPVVNGEKVSSFGLSEPNAGSDVGAIQTYVAKDGDYYVINGTKTFITLGTICDFVCLACWTDKTKSPGKGISIIVVEKGTPGFSVSRKLDKVGFHSSETGELVFEDCRVPRENLIGEEGRGFGYLMKTLDHGRITHAVSSVGIAKAALDEALRYANERVQFGQPIGKFQSIAFKLARMAMKVETARLMSYYAAWLYDQNEKCNKEAAMAKLYASEVANEVADEAMHVFGGYGYMMEYPVQRFWRDSKLRKITEGTSEIQMMVIARELGL
jgi:alkylation response protein AidB-like acyl-CoA dehydrogenase